MTSHSHLRARPNDGTPALTPLPHSERGLGTFAYWAPLPIRLIAGFGFVMHGYLKLARGPDVFVDAVRALGVPAPHLMAWLTILGEVFGGIALLAGAFVPLVSIPLAAILIVAIVTVHAPFGFSSVKLLAVTADGPKFGPPGYETNLLYLACLATLIIGGSGPFAFDTAIARRRRERSAQRTRHDIKDY